VAVPTHAVTGEYANDIERTYPLHPALIDVLNRKTSTIPNFQRTRGALRLLAQVIRRVWEKQESDAYLVSPAHVDLSVGSLREELTSRLDRQQYVPVIQADIWSEKGESNPSHAQQIDADWESKGKPLFGRRVAQTIFLHSLTHGKAKWATRAGIAHWNGFTDSDERMGDFDESVRKKLKNNADTAQLKLRQAVTRGYQHLFYPSGSAGTESGGLEHYTFRPQEGGTDAKRDIEKDLIKVLRQLGKVLTADDDALGPLYVEDKLWPDSRDHLSTEELRRAFCKKRAMPIVLAPEKLKETIRRGIEDGSWVYWDAQRGYGPTHPLPGIALIDDQTLYLPDSAPFCLECGQQPCVCQEEEEGGGEEGNECPLCGQDPCVCGTGGGDGEGIVSLGPLEGTPNKVFTALQDRCEDGEVQKLAGVRIACDDVDTLRRLGLAFSQLSGLDLSVEHSYTAQAGDDSVQLSYTGSWDGFEPSRDFTQKFEQRSDDRQQRTRITVRSDQSIAPDGREMERMLESFNSMEVGKVELTGSAADAGEEGEDGR
jgi:hypothetical protein